MHKAINKIYYHQHHCSHFMAATFDFTTFPPGFLKAALFYTAWLFLHGSMKHSTFQFNNETNDKCLPLS